ncbi:MAG: type IV secretory system conjugative DNA transfer family protein [Burkholderiales bacterium]|nr:type IV secretory system conjugative DNA transfer family protein [Burkholderiales bacterium]
MFWLGDVLNISVIEKGTAFFGGLGLVSTIAWVGLAWGIGHKNVDALRGSAKFVGEKDAAKLRDENQAQAKGAEVQLGQLSGGQPFAWQTDKHVLVVASSGSGKGTDIIIPNLLTYDGPVFVLDPKGENARATARHRARLGEVHCIDPWGLTGRPSSRFNPLARLADPTNAADVATGAAALAAALVLPDHGSNRYFTDTARQLLEGLIAFAVTDQDLRPVADLRLVRQLLAQNLRPTLEAMSKATAGPDSIRSNAGRMLTLGEREFGAVVSSAITETAFLDDPRLQDALSGKPERQVDFTAWSRSGMSVFLCLPPQYFKAFNRWLRLMVTAALDERMRAARQGPRPVMFLLDELASLERLQPVEDAVGLARGYGVQIWSIFQDLGQMKDIYKERATSFIGNAGIRMFFGTQDYETAKHVSDMLGTQTIQLEKVRGAEVVDVLHEGRNLLNPDEVIRLPQNEMIVFIPSQQPLRLKRLSYHVNSRLKGRWDDPRN